ncbi:type I pullulanase [Neobacillus sp. LXY-4]|uniref:type I pullulanase n=1 Tax=Neobacillus sp. LXY-4 TaxID=3379826 RepID=UPI003EDF9999
MNPEDRLFSAYLDEIHEITILLPKTYHQGVSNRFYLEEGSLIQELKINEMIPLGTKNKYICTVESEVLIGEVAWIIDEYGGRTDLQIGSVIRTKEFDQHFYYEGNDLGVTYFPDRVIFKIWAPTATAVKVKLIMPQKEAFEELMMNRTKKGVWFLEKKGDFELYFYSFLLCINMEWREAVDPYAVAVSANGEVGIIVDLEKTQMNKRELPRLNSPTDAIIYETHIRDFTIHSSSGVEKKGTYLGVAETDTYTPNGELTCLSYVKDLGVTHIEFLPFNDFEGVNELASNKEYNWGYNPHYFNVPEGSYSSDPNEPYARIKELKGMIDAIHKHELRVIMDVVYNHVFIRETSSFEKIVPGYYFRHDHHGMPSNGTGVGNDIASERLMVRKFIIDSIAFWMKEYHIDGFRFDLMGIIDIETMNQVRKTVDEMDPTALIIGEGWDLNTPIPIEEKANIRNQRKLPRIGQFNDWFRDSIKGSTFNLYDRGFCFGNDHYYEAAMQVLAGSIGIEKQNHGIFNEPYQSINYVESHDNHTLWDKFSVCDQESEPLIRQRRHRLATAMVLLSQGIPFLHSGQEFFRTKKGVGNSYRSPNEINWLDWDEKASHPNNVNYIKGLIDIRKSHRAFRLPTAKIIRDHIEFVPIPRPTIGYFLKEVGQFGLWDSILVLINPSVHPVSVELPDKEEWYILANEKRASHIPFGEIQGNHYLIESISLSVLVQ